MLYILQLTCTVSSKPTCHPKNKMRYSNELTSVLLVLKSWHLFCLMAQVKMNIVESDLWWYLTYMQHRLMLSMKQRHLTKYSEYYEYFTLVPRTKTYSYFPVFRHLSWNDVMSSSISVIVSSRAHTSRCVSSQTYTHTHMHVHYDIWVFDG